MVKFIAQSFLDLLPRKAIIPIFFLPFVSFTSSAFIFSTSTFTRSHSSRKGFISTPSYSQVVKPVNTRAVGRWKAYEKHFAEVLPIVQPYLDRWGYAA